MRSLFIMLVAVFLMTLPAVAADWPEDARLAMEAAGARLKTAANTAERVDALREIGQIAAANPDAPDALLTAEMLSHQAMIEAGPTAMLEALGGLAASGQITDLNTLASIAAPMLETVAVMQENGTLLPSSAIVVDDAISKLNAVAAKAGLPSVADAISEATGDPKLGSALTDALGRIAAAAKLARAAPNLAEADEKAAKEFIDNFVKMAGPNPAFALNPGGVVMLRDLLVHNQQMFNESAKALNLVADAIETGRFDSEAYAKISDRLNELSKGPWGSDTAKDVLKSLCKAIPIAGAWCDDAFKLVEELISGSDCSAITCDCQHVGGGLMRGPLIVQCELHQADLVGICLADNTAPISCLADAKGPGANH